MKFTVITTLISLSVFLQSQAFQKGYNGNLSWNLETLDLNIQYTPGQNSLSYQGVSTLESLKSENRELVLLLNSRTRAISCSDFELTDQKTGKQFSYSMEVDTSHSSKNTYKFSFSEPLPIKKAVEVSYDCEFNTNSEQAIVSDSIAYFSWVEGWYPFPKGKSDEDFNAGLMSAPGSITFHLPDGWHALSNGRLAESVEGQKWVSVASVARSFVVSTYNVYQRKSGDKHYYYYSLENRNKEDVHSKLGLLEKTTLALEKVWGTFPYESYAVGEIPQEFNSFDAASEQGFIVAKPNKFINNLDPLPLLGHEVGHTWWGNLVSSSSSEPGGILLTEALAQFSAALAIEEIRGQDAFKQFMKFSSEHYYPDQSANGYFNVLRRGWDYELSKLTSSDRSYSFYARSKGHWVFYMLRELVGEVGFYKTMKDLIRQHTGSSMRLADLRKKFISEYPEKDLVEFFEQWLDRKGAPVLSYKWDRVYGSPNPKIELTIYQLGDTEPYNLPLQIKLIGKEKEQIIELSMDKTVQEFELDTEFIPSEVLLDPFSKLLIWRADYGTFPVF